MKIFIFIMLLCVFSVSAQEDVRLTDDEYSVLRKDILENYASRPLDAVDRADYYLAKHDATFTLRQRVRMQYTKAFYQIAAEQFEDAFSTLVLCKQLADQLGDPALIYYYHSYIAGMFSTLENYELSASSYISALGVAKQTTDQHLVARAHNNVGHLLILLEQYDRALPYIEKFHRFGVENKVVTYQATALNNLGELALGKGNIEEAERYFKESLQLRLDNKLPLRASWSMLNLGKVSYLKKDYAQGKSFIEQSIEIRKKYKRELQVITSQLALVKVLFAMEEFDEAYSLLTNSINELNSKKSLHLLVHAYELQQEYHHHRKEFEQALEIANKRVKLNTELMQKKADLALVHHIATVELDVKEMDNLNLKKQNELAQQEVALKQRQTNIILISSGLVLLMILFFAISLSRKNRKLAQTRVELIEAEKMSAMTTLVSGMAHQLNTPIGILVTANSLMRDKLGIIRDKIEQKTLSQSQLEKLLDEFADSLQLSESNCNKTAGLIQQFKQISAELEGSELVRFELHSFIKSKLSLICRQYPNIKHYQVLGDNIQVNHYDNVLLRVLEQLIKNSAENKKRDENSLAITIEIKTNEEVVTIAYCDNGSGIPEDIIDKIFDPFFTTKGMQKSLGLGLNIAYNSVKHLMQGNLSCHASERGAKFLIAIPICAKEQG